MSKWKYRGNDDHDKLSKYQKIRKKHEKKKISNKNKEIDELELLEKDWDQAIKENDWFPARVVEVQKRYAFISPEVDGDINTKDVWLATVARKHLQLHRDERNTIVVGDKVLVQANKDKDENYSEEIPSCVIMHRAPRESKIARKDPMITDREHVLACNIDQLLIVCSYKAPLVKWGLIDRYLILAEEQDIEPIIILNKKDLLEKSNDDFKEKCREEVEVYRSLGYKVIELAVEFAKFEDPEIQEIHGLLNDKFTILSGHSGVGKSSLVNMFNPEIVQDVEENSDIFYKGRHTTTYASLIKLGKGGYVIDTPGIRSFVLDQRDAISLTHGFIELRAYMGKCKFRECRHMDEPGCKVLEALAEGKISERRYRSYIGLLLGDTGREGRTREDTIEQS